MAHVFYISLACSQMPFVLPSQCNIRLRLPAEIHKSSFAHHRVSSSSVVRASDWITEGRGSNPTWISEFSSHLISCCYFVFNIRLFYFFKSTMVHSRQLPIQEGNSALCTKTRGGVTAMPLKTLNLRPSLSFFLIIFPQLCSLKCRIMFTKGHYPSYGNLKDRSATCLSCSFVTVDGFFFVKLASLSLHCFRVLSQDKTYLNPLLRIAPLNFKVPHVICL